MSTNSVVFKYVVSKTEVNDKGCGVTLRQAEGPDGMTMTDIHLQFQSEAEASEYQYGGDPVRVELVRVSETEATVAHMQEG